MVAKHVPRALAAHIDWSTSARLTHERRARGARARQGLGGLALGLAAAGVLLLGTRVLPAYRAARSGASPASAWLPGDLALPVDTLDLPGPAAQAEVAPAAEEAPKEVAIQAPPRTYPLPVAAPGARWPFGPEVYRWQPLVEDEIKAARGRRAVDASITPELVLSVIAAESLGNPRAVSNADAVGLMQLLPRTFAGFFPGADPFDPALNVRAGLLYLSQALREHNGDLEWALAGYHAGISASLHARAGEDDLWGETVQYVGDVLSMRDRALVMHNQAPPPGARSLQRAGAVTIAALAPTPAAPPPAAAGPPATTEPDAAAEPPAAAESAPAAPAGEPDDEPEAVPGPRLGRLGAD